MSVLTPDQIRAACRGAWLARASAGSDVAPTGFSIDSRTVRPGEAFVAIRGETHDGHAYLADAVRAGAAMLIVDDAEAPALEGLDNSVYVLKVADTRRALMRLAAAHRRALEGTRVIAVTGSAGKTTTVRLIDALLSTTLRGRASIKSYNNEIGVPLTILSADPTDQYLVCEVGTNAPGEIASLASVVEPDVAVITSIGRAHLEGLGSIEGVVREKSSLLSHLRPGGLAVAPADVPELADALRCVPNVVTFGRADHADLRLTGFEHVGDGAGAGCRFVINDRARFGAPMIGEHNALNATAAIAVARRFGITDETLAAALSRVSSPQMRLQRLSIGGIEVINDAYNANPESVKAALAALSGLGTSGGRRVVVLGDMLELGEAGPAAHEEVAGTILDLGNIDMVVVVGHLVLHTAAVLARHWPQDRCVLMSDLDRGQARAVAELLSPGDTVLIKGSRRMRLERVVEAMAAGAGHAAARGAGAA